MTITRGTIAHRYTAAFTTSHGEFSLQFVAGNHKVSKRVLSLSQTAVMTCNGACDYCYARRCQNMRAVVRNRWNENTMAIAWAIVYEPAFLEALILKVLELSGCKLFRWHISGDFYDARLWTVAKNVARRAPHIQFYSYTKQDGLDLSDKPDNWGLLWSHANIVTDAAEIPAIEAEAKARGFDGASIVVNGIEGTCPAQRKGSTIQCGVCRKCVDGRTVLLALH